MTTVIYIPKDFVACDGLWSTPFGQLALENHYIAKYLYVNDKIIVFAGSEYAIVCLQALFRKIISKEYYQKIAEKHFLTGDSLEYLIINIHTGELEKFLLPKHYRPFANEIYHLGSGGEFAAHFFFYAKKYHFQTKNGKNNVEGALKYAYYKDSLSSGEPTMIKSWNPKYIIDTTVNNDNAIYDYLLETRFKELDMYINHLHQDLQTSLPKNLTLLSASFNYAYHKYRPLETAPSTEADIVMPCDVENILKDVDFVLNSTFSE